MVVRVYGGIEPMRFAKLLSGFDIGIGSGHDAAARIGRDPDGMRLAAAPASDDGDPKCLVHYVFPYL